MKSPATGQHVCNKRPPMPLPRPKHLSGVTADDEHTETGQREEGNYYSELMPTEPAPPPPMNPYML